MSNAIRNALDVFTDWLNQVHIDHPDMSTQAGEEVDSVVLTPTANEFERAYRILDYFNKIQSLNGFESIINDDTYKQELAAAFGTKADGSVYTIDDVSAIMASDLNNLVANWNVFRNLGENASGYARFYCPTNAPVNIASGTLVRTAGYPYTEYATLTAVNNEVPAYDATEGYYIDVYVECTTKGSEGNIPAGAIKLMGTSITNVSSVTNKEAFVNGTDAESDQDFITRSRDAWASKNYGTVPFFRNLLIGSFGVDDVGVVTPGDPLMQRMAHGAVDIYIKCTERITTKTEAFNHTYQRRNYTFINQPVKAITSVTHSVLGLIDPSKYALIKDDEALGAAGSTIANDMLDILDDTVAQQASGTTFTVVYTIIENVRLCQDEVDAEENNLVLDDTLVKLGYGCGIDISMTINAKAGEDLATVQSRVEYNLNMFFSGGTTENGDTYEKKSFGDSIEVSDILDVITDTTGVDQIILSTFIAAKTECRPGGNTYSYPGDDTFLFESIEYPILGTVAWL